jgi:hypothetical protein
VAGPSWWLPGLPAGHGFTALAVALSGRVLALEWAGEGVLWRAWPRRAPGSARSCGPGRRVPRPGTHSRLGRALVAWVRQARAAGLDDEAMESLLRVTLQAPAEEDIALRRVIETSGLTKRYRRVTALSDCTVSVPAGRISTLSGRTARASRTSDFGTSFPHTPSPRASSHP